MTSSNEYDIIDTFRRAFRMVGRLDERQLETDAVSLDRLRVNVDAAVAGVHFPWPCPNPHGTGWRAIMAATSDLASVGAQPGHLLLSVAVPDVGAHADLLAGMARGAAEAADRLGLALTGGNVTRGELQIHSIVTGHDRFPRAGFGTARPGDRIWLSGPVGDAAAELVELLNDVASSAAADHYWYPVARVAFGARLWTHEWVVGAIDISDGWPADLLRLLRGADARSLEHAPGARIDPEKIPRSERYQKEFRTHASPAVRRAAFVGGEDFELIFLTRDVAEDVVLGALRDIAPSMACVGIVCREAGIHWTRPPEVALDDRFGYDPYDGSPQP